MSARGTVFRLRGPVRGCSFGVVASTRRVADARVGAFEESHIIAAFIAAVAGATVYMIRSSSSAFAPNTPTPSRSTRELPISSSQAISSISFGIEAICAIGSPTWTI